MTKAESPSAPYQSHLDAARGYAIALVVFIHTFGLFPRMTWPAKNLASLGGHGVQLFFMVSALTLLGSWRREPRHDRHAVAAFLTRRFFRIAPAFWLAALLYALLLPAPGNTSRLLRVPDWLPPDVGLAPADILPTLLFADTLSPAWTKYTAGGWQVVPGSWSVSVEFLFYLAFPVLALLAWRPRRLVGLILAMMVLVPLLAADLRPWLTNVHGAERAGLFLDFWPLAQLPVFLTGFLLHAWFRDRAAFRRTLPWIGRVLDAIERHPARTLGIIVLLAGARAELEMLPADLVRPLARLPALYIHSTLLAGFVVVLARWRDTPLCHPWVRRLGEVSFSLYLCHWAVVELLGRTGWFDFAAPDLAGVMQGAALFLCTLACATPLAMLGHRFVERPFIRLGARFASRVAARRPGGTRPVAAAARTLPMPGQPRS